MMDDNSNREYQEARAREFCLSTGGDYEAIVNMYGFFPIYFIKPCQHLAGEWISPADLKDNQTGKKPIEAAKVKNDEEI